MKKLSLTTQYASTATEIPTRPQFRRWATAALEHGVQATLRIVDAAEGRVLNRDFRGKDYATNVLTFVYDTEPSFFGDIILCAEVVEREAREQKKALEAHYAHLLVHAMLHLQGYDHETDADAAIMEARETAIVTKLGYADPYQETAA
jgi:probable rRNA maturation factor